jgi:hypothetical protein
LAGPNTDRYEKMFGHVLKSKKSQNNLIVESSRISIDNLNSKMLQPDASTKINESSNFLKNRNQGLSQLESNYEFQQYND